MHETVAAMKTFVVLITFTSKGMESIKDSPHRSEAFSAHLRSVGIEVRELCWTFGAFDGVLIFDSPDADTAHSAILALAHAGNVRTQTLQAYDRTELEPLLAGLV